MSANQIPHRTRKGKHQASGGTGGEGRGEGVTGGLATIKIYKVNRAESKGKSFATTFPRDSILVLQKLL